MWFRSPLLYHRQLTLLHYQLSSLSVVFSNVGVSEVLTSAHQRVEVPSFSLFPLSLFCTFSLSLFFSLFPLSLFCTFVFPLSRPPLTRAEKNHFKEIVRVCVFVCGGGGGGGVSA